MGFRDGDSSAVLKRETQRCQASPFSTGRNFAGEKLYGVFIPTSSQIKILQHQVILWSVAWS